jgi:hypothetical protein
MGLNTVVVFLNILGEGGGVEIPVIELRDRFSGLITGISLISRDEIHGAIVHKLKKQLLFFGVVAGSRTQANSVQLAVLPTEPTTDLKFTFQQ